MPFPVPIVPPRPYPPGNVNPGCGGNYSEMWDLTKSWQEFSAQLDWMWNDMQKACIGDTVHWCKGASGGEAECCPLAGCYIVTGNNTAQFGQVVKCTQVPFRQLAHTITGYALNGSNMSLVIPVPSAFLFDNSPPLQLNINMPNSWFVQMTLILHDAINAMPTEAWHALKLGDTMPAPGNPSAHVPTVPPYPSIEQVFSTLLADKTASYMKATASSWPWTPPPPPPPPTPPPCPGGSLQQCMDLCPKAPIEDYKTCVKSCFDVCHSP